MDANAKEDEVDLRSTTWVSELFTPPGIAKLLADCPNIAQVLRTQPFAEQWTVHPIGEDGGKIHRTIRRTIPSPSITAATTTLDPPEIWPGWDQTYAIELHIDHASFDGRGVPAYDDPSSVKAWLMDFDNLDPSISGLRNTGFHSISLAEIGQLCTSRVPRGKQAIESIFWWLIPSFTIEELSTFGKKAQGLKELTLLPHLTPDETPKLTLADLPELVKVIREDFPALERLSIGLNATRDGEHDVIQDAEIALSELPWNGKLRHVEVVLQDSYLKELSGGAPILAVARNVACLGGPECSYRISLDRDGGTPPAYTDVHALEKVVKWFKSYASLRLML